MNGNVQKVEYVLTLTNDKGEQIRFEGDCSAGYIGEGPNGTLRILEMSGFDIDHEYIYKHSCFTLTK